MISKQKNKDFLLFTLQNKLKKMKKFLTFLARKEVNFYYYGMGLLIKVINMTR